MTLLLDNLHKKQTARPALWVMRQAGRYLPEYRELRKDAGSFLDLCYTPQMAKEVTLQPIRRFGMDGAILFSDILVIPQALGLDLTFVAGEGPKLDKLKTVDDISPLAEKIATIDDTLSPVYETVKSVKAELPPTTSLIGFCGAPWTVALYMVDDHPSKQNHISRSWCYQHPEKFAELLDILVGASTHYLKKQIEAGAEAIQIFDSWAGCVPDELFDEVIVKPTLKICRNIRASHPEVPIILFPKGVHMEQLEKMVVQGKDLFNCIGLDYGVDLKWAAETLQPDVCIQGNLDPAYLLTTPEIVRAKAQELLEIGTRHNGFIFNLGHGITPETPIENMQALVDTVKNFKSSLSKAS